MFIGVATLALEFLSSGLNFSVFLGNFPSNAMNLSGLGGLLRGFTQQMTEGDVTDTPFSCKSVGMPCGQGRLVEPQ